LINQWFFEKVQKIGETITVEYKIKLLETFSSTDYNHRFSHWCWWLSDDVIFFWIYGLKSSSIFSHERWFLFSKPWFLREPDWIDSLRIEFVVRVIDMWVTKDDGVFKPFKKWKNISFLFQTYRTSKYFIRVYFRNNFYLSKLKVV